MENYRKKKLFEGNKVISCKYCRFRKTTMFLIASLCCHLSNFCEIPVLPSLFSHSSENISPFFVIFVCEEEFGSWWSLLSWYPKKNNNVGSCLTHTSLFVSLWKPLKLFFFRTPFSKFSLQFATYPFPFLDPEACFWSKACLFKSPKSNSILKLCFFPFWVCELSLTLETQVWMCDPWEKKRKPSFWFLVWFLSQWTLLLGWIQLCFSSHQLEPGNNSVCYPIHQCIFDHLVLFIYLFIYHLCHFSPQIENKN